MHPYAEGVISRIERALNGQEAALQSAAAVIAEKIQAGGVVHVFGSGHSHLLAEELFTRAGGATFINPIFDTSLMVTSGYGKSTRTERLHGYARTVLEGVDIRPEDTFLVASNSGRNPVPIEAADFARSRGCYVVGLTSVQHSSSIESRHESGRKLMDVVDLVLDTCTEPGDTELEFTGSSDQYGPSSTIMLAAIAHTLICMVIENLGQAGIEPPIIRSANLDGSEEINRRRKARYLRRIPALGAPSNTPTHNRTE